MISIPANARLGKTRIRLRHIIAVQGADALTACNNMANTIFKSYDIEDYTITVIEKNTLPPSCPSVYSPANNAVNIPRNPGLTFTWSGSSGGTNTTYDFYLGTSPTSLAAVGINLASADGTTGKYSHPDFLEPSTTYYYKVVAKSDRGVTTCGSVQKFTTAVATIDFYCAPTANCDLFGNAYIRSVNFNALSNTTTCSGQSAFMLYPASGPVTTTVTKGSSYALRIETSLACNLGYLGAWIDYNRNGSFADAGEFIAIADQDPFTSCATRTVSISIPNTAVTGATRMRIRLDSGNPVLAGESCENYAVGETEDYILTVAAPAACSSLAATYTKTDNVAATGASGSITVTPSGGTLPYAISWSGGALSGFNPTGLPAGIYYATITDGAGCSYAMPPINIAAPPVFKIEGTTVIQPSCKENGSIRVDVSGGVGPYTISWNSGAFAGNFINNLPPGAYSAEVRDSQGQVLQVGPIALHTFSATYTTVPALCPLDGSGEIHVTTVGGIPPYRYDWIQLVPGDVVHYKTGDLPAAKGIYNVTITDAANCFISISNIEVGGPPPLAVDVSITPANCNGNGSATGEIWLSSSNGTAPYRYELYYNSELQSFTYIDDADGSRYVDVTAGQPYTIVAYDANNCWSGYINMDGINTLPEPDPAWGFMISCSGKPAEVKYGGYMPGMDFVWYEDAAGTIALDTAVIFTTPVLNGSVTYYMANYQHGCRSATVIPYTVSVAPTPGKPAITAGGSTTLCNGTSVSLHAPQGYAQYRWSSGEQTMDVVASGAGTYTVQVQDDFGCISPVSDPLNVHIGLPSTTPVITAAGALTFCMGGEVVLSAPQGYTTYRWSDNSSGRDVTVKSSGVYAVRATATGACESEASESVEVVVKSLPGAPAISANGPLSFCFGDEVLLTASGSGQYRWSTGAESQQILVNESGTYAVTITENDCESAASVAVVSVFDLPAVPQSIEQSSASTLRVIGASNAYTWTFNGNALTATTAEIVATASGRYEARGISAQGCVSQSGVVYDFVITGLEPAGQEAFSVYPNPSAGTLHVVVGKDTNRADVQIVNTLGQRFDGVKAERDGQELIIDVSALPAGFYMLTVKRGENLVVRPFVRQ